MAKRGQALRLRQSARRARSNVECSPTTSSTPCSTQHRNALTRYGIYVFKVTEIIPSEPTPLDQQRATAWEILSSEAQAGAIYAFRAEFRSRWRLRTTCAPVYKTHPDCSNPPTVE